MPKEKRLLLLHIIGSVGFLLIPVLSSPDFNSNTNLFLIKPFLSQFLRQIFLLLFFYFNYYFLLSKFYFPGKRTLYFLSILICSFIVLKIPDFLIPQTNYFNPEANIPPDFNSFPNNTPPRNAPFFPVFNGDLLQFILVFSLSLLLKLNVRYHQIKDEKLNAEVSYLKAQINPHFLFNTLNSLYALTLQKSDEAPKAVLKLSGIMRYVTTESSKDYVSLDKEIEYIKDYVSLQKLRLYDNVNLKFEVNGLINGKKIAPLMLIPFIENAFKYGVNPDEDSFVSIEILIIEKELFLIIENSIVNLVTLDDSKSEKGIENTKKRLDVFYSGKYSLDITNDKKTFKVELKLSLDD